MIFTEISLTVGKESLNARQRLNLRQDSWSRPSTTIWFVLALVLLSAGVGSAFGNTNKIIKENLKRGTTGWQLIDPAENRQIEGYASLTSVPNHGYIDLFVSTGDASYALSIYRMGWYGGTGGRLMLGPKTLPGVQQPMPSGDPASDLIECHWTQPFRIQVPYSWLSGIYLVKLHGNSSGKESYITFTVRDLRRAKVVFQQSVATYQAYNPWPGLDPVSGANAGQSLYSFQTKDGAQVSAVSFNRPYTQDQGTSLPYQNLYGIGAGDFLYNVGPVGMEYSMVRWLEHEGYDVTYITDIDTHEDINRLLRAKAFLSVGHDEYWSQEMKSNVVTARDLGLSLGFFGANYMYWPVEFYPDSNGLPNRTVSFLPMANRCSVTTTQQCGSDADCSEGESCKIKACYYSCNLDSDGISFSEQSIVGGMDQPGVLLPSIVWGADIYVSSDALINNWVFANTGLKQGDVIPGLIGIEYNQTLTPESWDVSPPPDPFPYPLPAGLQILLHNPAPNFSGAAGDPSMNIGGWDLQDDFDGKDFNTWYNSWALSFLLGAQLDHTCDTNPIPPLYLPLPPGYCRNPFPYYPDLREDWAMTVYQASSGAWVFNAATNQWSWGLDDYFTGLDNGDGVNNGPQLRDQCGYPFFHPGLVSCRNPAAEQITRNVLNAFISRH